MNMGQTLRLGYPLEHSFSIELNSREQLSGIALPYNGHQRVLIEGSLGTLQRISLVESLMLEVECSGGVLRVDLTEEEFRSALKLSKESEAL